MKCALVGSRYFAAAVLQALRQEPGIEFTRIVAPSADDRLALAAKAAGLPLHVLDNPKVVPAEAIAEGTDLILAAHTHARVSNEALARSRLGGVGYHPSLLPRHRGIAAVEWTILAGDAVAGGSVYHLADGWDAGAVALQDWCFVLPGDDARSLWERALAPMGLDLLARVLRHAREHGQLPSQPQDPRFATRAPMIRRAVVLTDDAPGMAVSLVLTVIGPDRPGIVRLLAQTAERHGANWAASRLSKLAGEFAGMIHLEVPPAQADALMVNAGMPQPRARSASPGRKSLAMMISQLFPSIFSIRTCGTYFSDTLPNPITPNRTVLDIAFSFISCRETPRVPARMLPSAVLWQSCLRSHEQDRPGDDQRHVVELAGISENQRKAQRRDAEKNWRGHGDRNARLWLVATRRSHRKDLARGDGLGDGAGGVGRVHRVGAPACQPRRRRACGQPGAAARVEHTIDLRHRGFA